MRQVIRSKAGAVVASIIVATGAGTGIWYSAVGGFGFGSAAVTLASSCTSSCSGTVTLSATAPPNAQSVEFDLNGVSLGVDGSKPFSWPLDTTQLVDGTYSLTAKGNGPLGITATSTVVSVSTSNAVAFTANLFVAPDGTTGAVSNCTAVTPAVTYATALAANHVCQGTTNKTALDAACAATNSASIVAGAVIGIKTGTYTGESGTNGAIWSNGTDCSGGNGATFNPNSAENGASAGSTSGWAQFKCADGDAGTALFNNQFNLNDLAHRNTMWIGSGNLHTIFTGSCFRFAEATYLGTPGGGAGVQNLDFVGTSFANPMQFFTYNMTAPVDVLLKNVSVGGAHACGKANDPNVPASLQCDPNGPWWESEWANWGGTNGSCSTSNAFGNCGGVFVLGAPDQGEPYIHDISQAVLYSNVRLQNVYQHDEASKCSVNDTCLQHDACLLTGNDNTTHTFGDLVIDHMVCERVAAEGIELHTGGTVIENSVFACVVDDYDFNSTWGHCTSSGSSELGLGADANQLTNVLVRHNDFLTGSTSAISLGPSGAAGGYSNVRIIGNIVEASGIGNCSATGVTVAYNSFFGATACGTNSQTLGSDPFTTTSAGNLIVVTSPPVVNPALTISVQAVPNNGAPNADYTLANDGNGAARGGTTSNAGAVGP